MIQNINTQLMLSQVAMTTEINAGSMIDLCVSSPLPLDLPLASKALQQAF